MKFLYIHLLITNIIFIGYAQESDRKFSISSYGEMLYQHFDFGPNQKATLQGSKPDNRGIIDIPRVLIGLEYNFLPDLSIEAEIEFEHLGTGSALELEYEEFGEYEFESEKGGEVILEEFYLSKSFSEEFNLRAGKFPIPFSLLNKSHRPVNFFTTIRPESESAILPVVWYETGFEIFGRAFNFNYRLALVNGLDAAGFSSEKWIAEGYQTKFETIRATNFAGVARLDYIGLNNLLTGASIYYGNSADNRPKPEDMEGIDANVTIVSLHGQYTDDTFIIRGDYIFGSLENSDIVSQRNARLSTNIQYPRSPVAKNAVAWYVEGGYNVLSAFSIMEQYKLFPFLRYEYYNSMEKVEQGVYANPRFKRSIFSFGLNFIWNNEIVIKLDYASRRVGGGSYNTENTIGFAVGYSTTFL